MAYDFNAELKRVKDYYDADPLQKRFSALITGETGSGKSYLIRTCRFPVHIDSFDPGGTKCLDPWIKSGDIIVDSRWENEDPYNPTMFAEWMKTVDIRMKINYFDHFATYVLDSASSWGASVMNYQLGGANRAGESPQFRKDYTPQKTFMLNYIKKLMNLPCDFILTGHLTNVGEEVGRDKEGTAIKKDKFRFYAPGQSMITIPMQFDELYVLVGNTTSAGTKREMLVDSQGKYLARSRLKADGKLNNIEDLDIKKLLKKIGKPVDDKPKLLIGE